MNSRTTFVPPNTHPGSRDTDHAAFEPGGTSGTKCCVSEAPIGVRVHPSSQGVPLLSKTKSFTSTESTTGVDDRAEVHAKSITNTVANGKTLFILPPEMVTRRRARSYMSGWRTYECAFCAARTVFLP